jgi:hypothetical protein
MNIITVFRDPVGWSLDMAQKMPKMKWTSELCQMFEETDVFDINKERVLKVNSTGTEGAFAMDMLKDKVQMACKQKLSVLAVNQNFYTSSLRPCTLVA